MDIIRHLTDTDFEKLPTHVCTQVTMYIRGQEAGRAPFAVHETLLTGHRAARGKERSGICRDRSGRSYRLS